MNYSELINLIKQLITGNSLILSVFSNPREKGEDKITKASLRPLSIKGVLKYQLTSTRGAQAFHTTLSKDESLKVFEDLLLAQFKQGTIYTSENDLHYLSNKNGEFTLLKKPPTKSTISLEHNRKKQYLLAEGERVPFLIELGVMSSDGKVVHKRRDKFRQINRFLEMIDDILPFLDKNKRLEVIDFGCGKAYLTFALYHYLHFVKGYSLNVIGLDLKKEVVNDCQNLADKLGYGDLKFQHGDINTYHDKTSIDMMVSLHACDTATDAALEKAVRWGAKVILAVPCCQHELFSQIKNVDLEPLLRHGILKERFAALVTDAARANLLEVHGYAAQIMEFIDMEHTPKNLLIRAVKQPSKQDPDKQLKAYRQFKSALSIDPALERML